MTTVSTPYRFVPLSRLVLLPDWAASVSHDHPFQDGINGELTIELTCDTPLCVGGDQSAGSDQAPGRVNFFRTPSGQPAIPGSALKGMVRNVLEIAAFARFRQVEDQKLGVRDISSSKNFYTEAMVKTRVQAGWLVFKDGSWQVTPCPFSRLHQADLIQWTKVPVTEWTKAKTAKQRYQRIGLLPPIRFEPETVQAKELAKPADNGSRAGTIVVTGQPGKAFNDSDKRSKKYEFVFHDSMSGEQAMPIRIDEAVMRGFTHIHRDSEEWSFWQEQLTKGKLEKGIPVFFHKEGAAVSSLGLAMMYKLPFKHSLHEAIGHTSPAHLTGRQPDLGDLIFGRIDKDAGSLRGRVGFNLATPVPGQKMEPFFLGPTVLANPKPSFYPAYIRQDDRQFRQLMQPESELAGWKRYPPKPANVPPPPEKSGPRSQVELEVVPEGSKFVGRIHIHNLRRVELGALLWALDFGGREKLRHGLGMGKPFGLGQVSLTLRHFELEPNDPRLAGDGIDAHWLQACRREFIDLMNQTLRAAGSDDWESSEPIQALLDHAKPADNDAGLKYLRLESFKELRTSLEDVKLVLHAHKGVTPTKGYDTNTPRGWTSRFNENLSAARQESERKELDRQHKDRLANASPDERKLLELQWLWDDVMNGTGKKTTVDKLNDALRAAAESWGDFAEEERSKLMELIAEIQQFDNKKIQKACKKFSALHEPST